VLAREWRTHGEDTLTGFAEDVYRTLQVNLARLPLAVHPLVDAMIAGNWLVGYASLGHVAGALRGMSYRHRVAAGIGTAADELARDYDAVSADFAEFFPELQAHCAAFLASHA
jgi:acyl carrier protein phosphodiesterase